MTAESTATESEMTGSTAVILLNWNGWEDTVECLASLREVRHPDLQVIVVDNGSTNDSVRRIRRWAETGTASESDPPPEGWVPLEVAWVRPDAEETAAADALRRLRSVGPSDRLLLIETGENLGFAAGNNVAIRAALDAGYRYVNLLNNDTVVEPDYLVRLMSALEEHPGWRAVGPKILFYHDRERIWYAGSHLRLWKANATHDGFGDRDSPDWTGRHETEHVSGCCFMTRADVLREFGLLDEDYFFGHEDWAYSTRLMERGQTVGVDLDARIYHKSGGSWGTGHAIYAYYFNKNRLLILKKEVGGIKALVGFAFYFLTRPLKLVPGLARGQRAELMAEWRAIRDFFLGRFGDYDREQAARRQGGGGGQ